jgi:hypothetical protein
VRIQPRNLRAVVSENLAGDEVADAKTSVRRRVLQWQEILNGMEKTGMKFNTPFGK